MSAVHWLRRNNRTTACGRRAIATHRDTRLPERVTCRTCLRVMAVWRRACEEMQDRPAGGSEDA